MKPDRLKEGMGKRIMKDLLAIIRGLAFIRSEMRNHWRIMSREVTLLCLE